jgi:hypothetical protein
VLDLPVEERLEATLVTTALGIANGADVVRVHDVHANVRAARMTDAGRSAAGNRPARRRERNDRPILLQNMRFEATHGYHEFEQHIAQPFEVDIELRLNLQPAGIDDDLTKTIDYGRVYEIVKR